MRSAKVCQQAGRLNRSRIILPIGLFSAGFPDQDQNSNTQNKNLHLQPVTIPSPILGGVNTIQPDSLPIPSDLSMFQKNG
jgi:hypothetical protein